jgi:tetratricopeptide (TPR) repeat protein
MEKPKAPIFQLKLLKNLLLACLSSLLLLASCQKKEEPKVQSPYPSSPIYAEDELKLLRNEVNQNPKDIAAWIKFGNTLMDSHRYQEAIDAYQKALELDQKKVDVRVDMGTCFKYIGQFEKAVEEYRKAIAIDPRHVNAYRNLGVVLGFDLGNKEEAIKALEESLRLSPHGPDADNARKAIAELTKA